jgi:hypothetical protein
LGGLGSRSLLVPWFYWSTKRGKLDDGSSFVMSFEPKSKGMILVGLCHDGLPVQGRIDPVRRYWIEQLEKSRTQLRDGAR